MWAMTVALAAVAGCVDLICYFTLFHIFTAHMSGNTVASAAGFETGDAGRALLHALPIPFFVLGVAFGVVVGAIEARYCIQASFGPTLVLEALALAIFGVTAHHISGGGTPVLDAALVGSLALPVVAMGLQNSTLRRIGGEKVRTTFVTGMLADFAEQATKVLICAGPKKPALISGSIWLCYLIGAAAGGVLRLRIGVDAIYLPVAMLLGVAALERAIFLRRRYTSP